eukprot:GGOE01044491.1.p1 GENE.GGOE01044491.1~~GGOE01044491.1.p1  ORF type:complete len:770 (+),score=194.99 GGOE01044491.1:124-2433(+)
MKGANPRAWILALLLAGGLLLVVGFMVHGPWLTGGLEPVDEERAGGTANALLPVPPSEDYPYHLQRGLAAYLAVEELPLRKLGIQSREITSFNVRGHNYDFGNYLYLDHNEMVIMEDEGPGCVYRLFLIFNHQVQNYHLFRWILRIDGSLVYNITLKELLVGRTFPFVPPLSGARSAAHQGLYTSVPVCYTQRIRMSFWHRTMYNGRNFHRDMMYTCVETASYCHHMPMWNVDWHQFATPLPASHAFPQQYAGALQDANSTWRHVFRQLQNTAVPPTPAVPTSSHMEFNTTFLSPGSSVVIFSSTGAGVITQLLLCVSQPHLPERGSLRPLGDWNHVRLTLRFDGAEEPQVDRVPLGYLLGANLRHWLHKAQGYLVGVAPMEFTVQPRRRLQDWVGYVYFPMPYWSSASVSLDCEPSIAAAAGRVAVHYAVTARPTNPYPASTTGHFVAVFRRAAPSRTWQPFRFLDVRQGWGHIVGMNLNLEGLRDIIQGDPQFYLDHSSSAVVQGTGIEDWFNYAHGWEFQEPRNQSDALSGVPAKGVGGYFVADKRNPRKKVVKLHGDKALINGVHAYRRMPVDCIVFNDGIRGHFEIGSNWTHNNYRSADDIATTTFLYAHHTPGITRVAVIDVGNSESEAEHEYHASGSKVFTVQSTYVGDVDGPVVIAMGRSCSPAVPISFSVRIPRRLRSNYGLLLRRIYDSSAPNQRAEVLVDRTFVRVWLSLGGNTVSRISEADLVIAPKFTTQRAVIRITVQPRSEDWRDFAYHAFLIH